MKNCFYYTPAYKKNQDLIKIQVLSLNMSTSDNILKKYDIIKRITVSNSSIVSLISLKTNPKELFILKEIQKSSSNNLHQEVELLKQLKHPHIINYIDDYNTKDVLYVITEYCNQGDLDTFIKYKKNEMYFTEIEVLSIFKQVISAIYYMHKSHVLHRDLKSSNIFIHHSNDSKTNNIDILSSIIKVGDLGIARILNTSSFANTVIGTPYYLSPEICMGKNYDHKSDIWSLGIILYELLELKYPFQGKHLPELINKIIKCKYQLKNTLNYHISIQNLLRSMLDKDSDKRHTIDEIINLDLFHHHHIYIKDNKSYITPIKSSSSSLTSSGTIIK